MAILRKIGCGIRALFHQQQVERELDEELGGYLESAVEAKMRAGMSRPEALRAARAELGSTAAVKDEVRDVGWESLLETFWQDVRFAARVVRKNPGYTTVAVLTLALGIGANTAVFSLVHAVMLKSLPVTRPEQLFRVGDSEMCCVNDGLEGSWALFSYDLYRHLRDNTPAFDQLAAFQAEPETVGARAMNRAEPAQSRRSEFVSGNYFQMFGIGAYAGRVFTADDDQAGAAPVAVLSYRAWKEKYGADPSLVGASFAVNGQPFTICGVAPPGFFGDGLRSNPPELWIPLAFEPRVHGTNSLLRQSDQNWLNVTGRLPPGAQPRQVESQMTIALRQWLLRPGATVSENDRKEIPKQVIRLTPGGSGVRTMREVYEDGLKLLLWVTGLVLLIACANLANLVLARATARRQETSVRAALGASRLRLVRQAFSETLLLALLGAAAGVWLAIYGTHFMLNLAFPNRYVPIDATPSWPVLGFALGLSLLTGFLFGTLPAWLTAHTLPVDALRAASRATEGRRPWAQRSLVIVQVALSLVLICAAGLVVQSLRNLRNQHFGFATEGRYIVRFDPQMAGYRPEQLDVLYHRLRDRLQQIPGVQAVSYAMYTPMSGNNWEGAVNIEGRHSDRDGAVFVRVGPGYFDILGTRIVQGRPITEQDTASSRPVAVVNQEFVKRYLAGQNPIGHHFGSWGDTHADTLEIVGVTEDTNYWSPTQSQKPMFFVAAPQEARRDTPDEVQFERRSMYLENFILRTAATVPELEKQVRRAFGQVNPDLPVTDIAPFAEQVRGTLNQQEMIAQLMTVFGLLALVLATVGLYGVTAYGVARRTNEIGIRMALGADRVRVVRMVMGTVALQCGIGLVIGIPLSLGAGRMLASRLFGVRAFSLAVFVAALAALGLSALIAGFLPARHAAGIEPMQALRIE